MSVICSRLRLVAQGESPTVSFLRSSLNKKQGLSKLACISNPSFVRPTQKSNDLEMGNRADNNDGSCREVLTGRHVGKWRVQFIQELDTGAKQRLSRIFPTKTEAKTFLRELRSGTRKVRARSKRELTLGEWFEWLAVNDWPETLASNTITYRRSRFKNYVETHLGHLPLSHINPFRVKAFYNSLRDQGKSQSLIIAVKADLVRAFNQAVTPYQQVPMTVANPFRLPLQQAKPRRAIALTPSEVKSAIEHAKLDDLQRAMLGSLLLAGLRLGELMALTREQLQFDHDIIVIDRAVRMEGNGRQQVGLPKGGKTRNAVMCGTLKAILLPFTLEMSPEDFLFSAANENKPRMKKLVYATWRTIVRDANLPHELTPHDCRLTHINIIEKLMPNVSVTSLKEHVGHSATGVTEANYTRPLTTSQAILRNELDRIFG